ncbi:bifunctional hydroxymethylpyrimidine kinase/phosphomethylpyrimidine kinase [Candidatus Nitrosotenuis chungbukensis]|uniref:bifunctional hydroxymethylpyrimidine kinase/phosphomethylpyrimidine kinase n=1 Tax=Candidatus Nitrosotenuis chungbukensis TaxID=1353246 RepID=UPI0005B2C35A|nr:bifunctional hydroxymethylpyrimidine kinase/phosphomethylpyrimidine kinase [Candidatus Nitrosotenuis chungbukensis]
MNILSIGGSDPSSGAGVQGDVRAASALGVNCFSAITAITSQNSAKFLGVEPVSPKTIEMQIDAILSDFKIDAITIGMVYDSDTIRAIHSKLRGEKIPIILDPVIESTTGGVLLKKSALEPFRKLLIPLCHAITPNVSEAEALSGVRIAKESDLARAARKLSSLGAKKIVITGHKFAKNKISDFIFENKKGRTISGDRINYETHGSGCTFSFALAYAVASKNTFDGAVKFAKHFTYQSIENSQKSGRGVKITNPGHDRIRKDLSSAIAEFGNLRDSYGLIPECQTNFVYSKQDPKSVSDVLGVSGRIVKAGRRLVVAGDLEYGGSKHVATAVLTMQKKFPKIRAAINIKYDQNTVEKLQRAKNKISSYDRTDEPASTKNKENSSISWGVERAIRNLRSAPDAIYHTGDIGKEPMIIVFGKNPKQVVAKISKIL